MNTQNNHPEAGLEQTQNPNRNTGIFQKRVLPAMAAFALLAACSGKGGVEAVEFDSLNHAQSTLTQLTGEYDKAGEIDESLESALPLYKADILSRVDEIIEKGGEGSSFVDSDGGNLFISYIDTDDNGNTIRKIERSSGSDVLDQAPAEELRITQNDSGQTEITYTSRDGYVPGGEWIDTQETSIGYDNDFRSMRTHTSPYDVQSTSNRVSFDDGFGSEVDARDALGDTLKDLAIIMQFIDNFDEAVAAN